jgi:membrane-associated phospholipid phosphatase
VTARSFVLLLLTACVAGALAVLASTGRLVPGEVVLARWLQDAPLGHAIEELADALASPFVEYTLVGVVAAAALRLRQYALAATALLALAGMAVNPAIKELVQRGRPTDADVVIREHPGGFGFPSGHVQSATLVYGYAAVSATRLLSRNAAAIAVAASLAAVAAFDRVYNGAHWPSDVAGGALIGLLLVAAAVRLPQWVRDQRGSRAARGTPADGGFG